MIKNMLKLHNYKRLLVFLLAFFLLDLLFAQPPSKGYVLLMRKISMKMASMRPTGPTGSTGGREAVLMPLTSKRMFL